MSQREEEREQERRRQIGHESWDRLIDNARALGAFGRIEIVGQVEDGRLIVVREAAERTHK